MHVSKHGNFYFSTNYCFFNQYPFVVRQRMLNGAAHFVNRVGLGNSYRRAHVGWFHKNGQAKCVGGMKQRRLIDMCFTQGDILWLRNAVCVQHLFSNAFVHGNCAAQHARANVCNVCKLEHALNGAIFAKWAVQQREDDGSCIAACLFDNWCDGGWLAFSNQHICLWLSNNPFTFARDAHGSDVVFAGVECLDHMGCGHTTDVVLCGLAAE